MTIEELYKKLGYDMFAYYDLSEYNIACYPRQTGRTIKNVIETVYSLITGKKVLFVGSTKRQTDYVKSLVIKMLERLELKGLIENIEFMIFEDLEKNWNGIDRSNVFIDHSCDRLVKKNCYSMENEY